MSLDRFRSVVEKATLGAKERQWFVQWIAWYQKFCGVGPRDIIPTDRYVNQSCSSPKTDKPMHARIHPTFIEWARTLSAACSIQPCPIRDRSEKWSIKP